MSDRPKSLTIYLCIVWVTKLALIAGGVYFMLFISEHKNFYSVTRLENIGDQYLLLALGHLVVLAGTIGIYRMKKNGFYLYLAGKAVETVALLWALSASKNAISAGFEDASGSISYVIMMIVMILTIIFPLGFYTFSKQLR